MPDNTVVKNDAQVPKKDVELEGAKDVKIQILVGPEDGSDNIVMRRFEVAKGGHSPYHSHGYEHVVKILSGKGTVKDAKGVVHPLEPGMSVFVPAGTMHGFANAAAEPFAFLCIIPNQERKT